MFYGLQKGPKGKKRVFQYITADFDIFDPPTPFIGTLEAVLEVKPMPSMAPRTMVWYRFPMKSDDAMNEVLYMYVVCSVLSQILKIHRTVQCSN